MTKQKEEKKSSLKNILSKRIKVKKILKPSPHVTIDVSQPVYSHDRSRFFDVAYEEEKKQLFFNK